LGAGLGDQLQGLIKWIVTNGSAILAAQHAHDNEGA
jgi:hypothetical protein